MNSVRDGGDAGDDDGLVPVTESLDRLLRSLRASAGRVELHGVFGRWEEAVGAAVAANVRPIRLERGTLLVEVVDPGWATQVRFLADDLRARVREVTGVEIDTLEVRVGRPPSTPP